MSDNEMGMGGNPDGKEIGYEEEGEDVDYDEDNSEDQDDDDLDSQIGVEPGADVGDDNQGGGFKNKRGYKKNTEKITAKFLTKYERARILGTRAL